MLRDVPSLRRRCNCWRYPGHHRNRLRVAPYGAVRAILGWCARRARRQSDGRCGPIIIGRKLDLSVIGRLVKPFGARREIPFPTILGARNDVATPSLALIDIENGDIGSDFVAQARRSIEIAREGAEIAVSQAPVDRGLISRIARDDLNQAAIGVAPNNVPGGPSGPPHARYC